MKKKIIALLSLVLCLVLCISLAACSGDKHEAKSEWTSDDAMHWHECATEGHTDKFDEAAHTWNDGEITADPTEAAEGVKTYTCTVCGKKKTESLEKLAHNHTYATEWSKDATSHWHASDCGHDVKSDEAAHTFDDGVVTTDPTETTDGVKTFTCTVCGYEKTESVAITVSKIEFTYNAKPQPIDSLVNARNKKGMVIKYVGVDGTTYEESTTAPTNAGTYQYTITIPAATGWEEAELSGKFTIAKYELTFLYEKITIEYDGETASDGTKRIWFKFNTLEDNTSVNIAVIMESANVGAKVSEIWLPGLLQNGNYTADKDKVQIEIVAKKLSNLKFEIVEDDVKTELPEQTITREIEGVNGEKITVEITFNPEELLREDALDLSFDGKGGAVCIIRFQTENPNYVLDLTLGELKLVYS